jgi:AraC-type DNA-binding domain-containing proteins
MDKNLHFPKIREQNLLIKYNADENWKMDKYDCHDMFEINYCLSDNIEFFVNDIIYPVTKGTVFVFNNSDIHRSISLDKSPYKRYVLHFNPEYIKDLCTHDTNLLDCFINRKPQFNHSIHLTGEQINRFIALINKAQFYNVNKVYGQEIYEKIILSEILLFINPLYSNNIQCCSSKSNKEFEKIQPVLQHIQFNIDSDLSLDSLSKDFYINKYYLLSLFKKATGFTITEYIIKRRIIKACELLKKGLPVQQVGEMAGFNNNSHFIRTFKKVVGKSPKQYAKQFYS